MRKTSMLQRKLRYLACAVAALAIATAGLTLAGTKSVFAEFQIQEAGIDKGEVELEYRGAYHWGVPQVTDTNEKQATWFKVMSSSFRWASTTGGSYR